MAPEILIVPDELDGAAQSYRSAALSLSQLGCRFGAEVPAMPIDLQQLTAAMLARARENVAQQQQYMRREADDLVRRADLARKADAPGLAAAHAGATGPFDIGDVKILDARFVMPPPPPPPPPPPEEDDGSGFWDGVHVVLDGLGFVPGVGAVPDVINGVIYAIEGDTENALWSFGAAIPGPGDVAKGTKIVKELVDEAATHGDEVVDLTKNAGRSVGTVPPAASKAIDEAAEAASRFPRPPRGTPFIQGAPSPKGPSPAGRPTWRQSEKDARNGLGPNYKEQQSYRNGQPEQGNPRGSSRPDMDGTDHDVAPAPLKDDTRYAVEVKNYDVKANESGLLSKIDAQIEQRKANLPPGTQQEVFIDVRGQNVSPEELRALKQKIIDRTGGELGPADITFMHDYD